MLVLKQADFFTTSQNETRNVPELDLFCLKIKNKIISTGIHKGLPGCVIFYYCFFFILSQENVAHSYAFFIRLPREKKAFLYVFVMIIKAHFS